jgi:hypothetical protein
LLDKLLKNLNSSSPTFDNFEQELKWDKKKKKGEVTIDEVNFNFNYI